MLIVLQLNKALVDGVVLSEHGKVNHCYFKPGSVERSIDLDEEDVSQLAYFFKFRIDISFIDQRLLKN
jgi:hypothetical protein